MRQRQHEKAITECKRAVELDPNSAEAYTMYGRILHFAGKHQEAVGQFKKASRLDPMAVSCSPMNLGISYQHLGRHEEAINKFNETIHIAPGHVFARLRMAASYSILGRDKEARFWVAEVYKINPNFRLEPVKNTLQNMYKYKSDSDLCVNAMYKAGFK